MKPDTAVGVGRLRGEWAWGLACFVAVFFYVWLAIEPRLQYHTFAPVFFTTSHFFSDFVTYPGGLTDYSSAFLLQFFRVSWLGALITTGMAAVLYLASRSLLVQAGWGKAAIVSLIPSVLLLVVQSEYGTPWFARVLGVVAAVLFAAGYALSSKDCRWRGALFLVLSAPIYLALGGAYLLFALICVLFELFIWKRFILACFMPAVAFLLPWVAAKHVFVISLRDAYFYLVPFTGLIPASWALKSIFIVVPILVLVTVFRRNLAFPPQASPAAANSVRLESGRSTAAKSSRRSSGVHHAKVPRPRPTWKGWLTGVLSGQEFRWISHPRLWVPVFALVIVFSFPVQGKLLARIDYHAERGDWPEVIKLGGNLRAPTAAAVHDINRALAHADLLLDRMFEFPQKREWELWLNLNRSLEMSKLLKSSELLLELGHVNRAERMAAESLELNGYSPETLQQLFLISVLKGQPKTGLPFLNLLSRTLWHRDWAESYRRALEVDPTLSNDVGLQKVRPLIVVQDYVGAIPDNVLMQISLRQKPENRMPFQYLMAFYLLSGQLEKVAQNLERLRALKLPVVPRHLQEAIVLFEKTNPGAQLDLHGLAISPAIEER